MGGAGRARTPDELLAAFTARQWAEVEAYAEAWGIPAFRDDVRTAVVAHASAAPHVRRRLKIADFIPKWGPQSRRRPQTVAEQKAAMGAIRALQQSQAAARRQMREQSAAPPPTPTTPAIASSTRARPARNR